MAKNVVIIKHIFCSYISTDLIVISQNLDNTLEYLHAFSIKWLHPTLGGPQSTVSQIFYEYKLLKDEDAQVIHTLSDSLHVYSYSYNGNPAYTLCKNYIFITQFSVFHLGKMAFLFPVGWRLWTYFGIG